ncbi:TonB-linked SusC/RagA family outer membrane protein [Chitinophaga skermanii]|uniref:TonB-linked SusC/RagA family outer membrane protein n=1 Tax=Chitinophaga skermanii TaxID=331697 RepID=A0A327QX30_9BACT|nr:SusC/RagA family TonB-linked outer membrane protein [Chitinophaga skermanii]RAJ08920.1 TonB-linked SusC/RagA family outer membrane protein [Chitinophaga skermanii]
MLTCRVFPLLRLSVLIAMGTTVATRSAGQLASAASGKRFSSKQEHVASNEQKISLKDALQKVKVQYGIKIAYREGLLDGKSIPANDIDAPYTDAESMMKHILQPFQLDYKRINDKQYSVFPKQPILKKSSLDRTMDEGTANQLSTDAVRAVTTGAEHTVAAFGDVKGKVVSAKDGSAIIGATVMLKGNSRIGASTDVSGNFTLHIPKEYDGKSVVLVVAFMGYDKQEVTVQSGQGALTVQLEENTQALNEVVVTAFGIKKERKGVAASITEVKGSEFTQAREINIANALTGKVAGVNATSLASGAGGSSRVIIRGNGSLNGNNQPLYVVNGIPIDNTTLSAPTATAHSGFNSDRGDGIAGINPDDIETMTVLKSGAAAALYGSRAANGVIVITTKKGRAQKGVGIDVNSTYTVETPSVFPDWQYVYGEGREGIAPTTQASAINDGRISYGAKLDGSDVIQFDGVKRPYVAQKNNIKNFYQPGSTFTNTIAFTGGSEIVNFRFSLSNMENKSIIPNNTLNKKIANLNVNANLGKRWTIEAVSQFNYEESKNRPVVSDGPGNPNWAPYMIATNVDIRSLDPGYDPATGKEIAWNGTFFASNPYFVVNKFQNRDTRNRFINQASIAYKIQDNLVLKGRVGQDYANTKYVGIIPTNTGFLPGGGYQSRRIVFSETNAELTLNYNTKLSRDFSLSAMAGGNQARFKTDGIQLDGQDFTEPFFYSERNIKTATYVPLYSKSGINSLFSNVDIDYKSYLFLTLTARNDWFSTLSPKNNSILYPSIGSSFIFSEAFNMPKWLTYGKVRTSWAQVGGATPTPYALGLTYTMLQGSSHLDQPLQTITQSQVPNSNLKPLTSTTYEAGFELKLFNNRFGIDATYYDRRTTNDIVQATISNGSGYLTALVNIGRMSNKGVELLLTGTPVKKRDFTWDVSYNMAYNRNRVEKLSDGLTTLMMDRSVNNFASIVSDVGRPYGLIKGYRKVRNDKGELVFDANGFPAISPLVELGEGVSPWTMGITNTFTYKNFNLSFLIDGKFGGSIYSATNLYATRFGLHKMTLPGREDGITLTGVDKEGKPFSRTWPAKDMDDYYDYQKNYTEIFVYDASFLKLRQVTLGYNIPAKFIKSMRMQSASISFVARNLFILYKNTPNIDPESTFNNTNAQGIEMMGIPRTRSFGANLLVKF